MGDIPDPFIFQRRIKGSATPDEVALRRLSLTLHDNCSVSYYENSSYEIFV